MKYHVKNIYCDCKVGESAKENWALLDETKDNDLFFHFSSFPSCFVIMSHQDIPTLEDIRYTALLCKNNTQV